MSTVPSGGSPDLAVVRVLLAEPARAQVLLALADGRALPASVLASEAGVAASTISSHLKRLLDARFITVRQYGRFRYYQLAGPQIGELIEAVGKLTPTKPVTSLRQGTRAHAIRHARRCYNHLAGHLGVAITDAFLQRGYLTGHDGSTDIARMPGARPAGGVLDGIAYILTDAGAQAFEALGATPPANRAVRCCVDWTEQRHHMAGEAGSALLIRLQQLDWIRPSRVPRTLTITAAGRSGLAAHWSIDPGVFT